MVENKKRTQKKIAKQAGNLLALMPADPELKAPVVVSQWARPEGSQRKIEQVGSGYEVLKKKFAVLEERVKMGASAHFEESESEEEVEEEEEKKGGNDETDGPQGDEEDYGKKRKTKSKADLEREAMELGDLYGLLGMEEIRLEATEKDITKAYRKLALKYHPDKVEGKITPALKAMWLQVQAAYETLCDPAKRRRYDSTLPFDDEIPEVGKFTDETFYETYDKVFIRNSRWSKKEPVPRVGDANTPLADVYKFYKFWDNFETWREFCQYDEYDPLEANDRYERRYMEHENKKLRAVHVKAERARLLKLSEMAYQNDPRIKVILAAEEAEKEAIKAAKKDHKAKLHAEKFAAVKALEDAKLAEVQSKEDQKKNEAAARRQRNIDWKASLKKLNEILAQKLSGTNYDRFWVESIQKKFQTAERVETIIVGLDAIPADAADRVDQFVTFYKRLTETEAEAAVRRQKEAEIKAEEEKKQEWTKDEVALLTKGVNKFPAGTGDRWKVISDFIGTKGEKETIKKAQELANKRQKELEERQAATKKAEEEALAKAAAAKEHAAKVKAAEQAAAARLTANPDDGWNATQVKQMEEAMKEFPATLSPKERWIKIAEKVDDKEPKACYERFRTIVAKLKAQKDAAAKTAKK